MSNDVRIFDFDGEDVRVIPIDNEPWFVARDLCNVLGYSNMASALEDNCRGVATSYPIVDRLGRTQEVRIVSEPDMYRLIVRSRLPDAVKFEKWVMEEVLPSIRKNGGYLSPKIDFSDPDNIQKILDAWKIDRAKLIAAESKIEKDAPKIESFEALMHTDTDMSITEASKHFELSPKLIVFPFLREKKFLTQENLPTQKAINENILRLREIKDFGDTVRKQAVVKAYQLETWRTILVPCIKAWMEKE